VASGRAIATEGVAGRAELADRLDVRLIPRAYGAGDVRTDDRLEDGGTTLIYEGTTPPGWKGRPHPKSLDQPEATDGGRLTQNGLFHRAALQFNQW